MRKCRWGLSLGGVALLLSVGCQTIPYRSGPLPVALQAQFGKCAPRDGGLHFRLEGAKNADFRADFLAKEERFRMDVYDPLGRTLLGLHLSDAGTSLSGRLAMVMEGSLQISEGWFYWQEHFLGVRWLELGCLLGFVLPETWAEGSVSAAVGENEWRVLVQEKGRNIEMSFVRTGETWHPARIAISWRPWIFFPKQEIIGYYESSAKMHWVLPEGSSLFMKNVDEAGYHS